MLGSGRPGVEPAPWWESHCAPHTGHYRPPVVSVQIAKAPGERCSRSLGSVVVNSRHHKMQYHQHLSRASQFHFHRGMATQQGT